jgi:hypothetical protein
MSVTLSSLIDSLSALRSQKKHVESDLKTIEERIGGIEYDIMRAMDAEGITESKSAVGKVVVSESVYPKLEQWEQFADYVLSERALYLLEKRPAVLAYREQLTLGRAVPGLLPYTKRKVTFKEA